MQTKTPKRAAEQCVSVTLQELIELSKQAKGVSLLSLKKMGTTSGQRVSRLLARGMEFVESRRYQSGDDIRNMDWRVTARTGRAHTKLFAAEKDRQVILCADMRSAMFFATKGVFKSVQTALTLSSLAWSAIQSGDRIGGVVFDDCYVSETRPAVGKRGVLSYLHELAKKGAYRPSDSCQEGGSQRTLELAVSRLIEMSTPGSFVFFMSDFRHLSQKAYDRLSELARHCDLCLCFVYDPLEAAFPGKGTFTIANRNEDRSITMSNRSDLERYHRQFLERKQKVSSLAVQRHIHFFECTTEDDYLDILLQKSRAKIRR